MKKIGKKTGKRRSQIRLKPKKAKAIGRGRTLSGVHMNDGSPLQPGTVELRRQGFFGPVFARMRSDAEAAKAVGPVSTSLQRMLDHVLKDLPPKGTPEQSLYRNREIQQRMIGAMEAGAEAMWPGFRRLMTALGEREAEIIEALGTVGVGVA